MANILSMQPQPQQPQQPQEKGQTTLLDTGTFDQIFNTTACVANAANTAYQTAKNIAANTINNINNSTYGDSRRNTPYTNSYDTCYQQNNNTNGPDASQIPYGYGDNRPVSNSVYNPTAYEQPDINNPCGGYSGGYSGGYQPQSQPYFVPNGGYQQPQQPQQPVYQQPYDGISDPNYGR